MKTLNEVIQELNKEYLNHLRKKLEPYMINNPKPMTIKDLELPEKEKGIV